MGKALDSLHFLDEFLLKASLWCENVENILSSIAKTCTILNSLCGKRQAQKGFINADPVILSNRCKANLGLGH
ncbi:hypothetical protein Y032_0067g32 [Ancylostoma ceylanicum]|uniref:Uncharacterized protein n=1 Tax=Ancylostoma ceylanicum TaxID=53326 RepID=A0A016U019_9BILA|nr:hypothetical protein Y032_0067g32 [Ancylostoma ceylanicum]